MNCSGRSPGMVAGTRPILYRGETKRLPLVFPYPRAGGPCLFRLCLELPMTATAAPTVLTARALLLDMDGTLVNSDAVVERIWRSGGPDQGLGPPPRLSGVPGRAGTA